MYFGSLFGSNVTVQHFRSSFITSLPALLGDCGEFTLMTSPPLLLKHLLCMFFSGLSYLFHSILQKLRYYTNIGDIDNTYYPKLPVTGFLCIGRIRILKYIQILTPLFLYIVESGSSFQNLVGFVQNTKISDRTFLALFIDQIVTIQ